MEMSIQGNADRKEEGLGGSVNLHPISEGERFQESVPPSSSPRPVSQAGAQYALAKIVLRPSRPVTTHLPRLESDRGMQRGVAPPVSSRIRRSSSGEPAK